MMVAAAGGMIHIVTALLNQGAPWNAVDRRGWCAGDYAAEAGHEQVFEAVVEAGDQLHDITFRSASCLQKCTLN